MDIRRLLHEERYTIAGARRRLMGQEPEGPNLEAETTMEAMPPGRVRSGTGPTIPAGPSIPASTVSSRTCPCSPEARADFRRRGRGREPHPNSWLRIKQELGRIIRGSFHDLGRSPRFSGNRSWVFALIAAAVLTLNLWAWEYPALAGEADRPWVAYVKDGDTVVTDDKAVVRLAGIDAPELKPSKNPQPFAREAKALLEDLVKRRKVEIEPAEEMRDRYGRILGLYLCGRALDQPEDGGGRAGPGFSSWGRTPATPRTLIEAERRAKRSKKGLWAKWKGRWGR